MNTVATAAVISVSTICRRFWIHLLIYLVFNVTNILKLGQKQHNYPLVTGCTRSRMTIAMDKHCKYMDIKVSLVKRNEDTHGSLYSNAESRKRIES